VASLLTIIALTGCHLPTHQQKVAFFKTALPSVLSWVQTHHFTVRVHAQAALHKIWLHCKEQGLTELLDQHCIVEQCVHFSGLSKFVLHSGHTYSMVTECFCLVMLQSTNNVC
jgi:hypothetical protein